MEGRIEVIDRRRTRLVVFLLAIFGLWYGFLLGNEFYRYFQTVSHGVKRIRVMPVEVMGIYYLVGLALFLVSAVSLLLWWLYMNRLKKDPDFRAAFEDEFVKQNWLKAYRFSFFCIVGLNVLLLLNRALDARWPGRLSIIIDSMGIHLLLFTAVVSCLGSFLYNNRGR